MSDTQELIKQVRGHEDIEHVEEELLHNGYLRVKRLWFRYKRFDGKMSEAISREVLDATDVAVVLPYDPVEDHVVLIEQCRAGAIRDSQETPWLLECVAGMNDKTESLEQLAYRELEEEAGLIGKRMKPVHCYWVSPGISGERIQVFCAEVDMHSRAQVAGLEEEAEDIKTHIVPADRIQDLLDDGIVNTGPAIMALQWFLLHRDALRREWLA